MKVGKGKLLFSAAKEDGKFGIINILVEKEDDDDDDDDGDKNILTGTFL